ncbi:hypothetical protein CQR48_0985 [Bifidobacterium thermophilum]|nr:hypothetical protein CQR48_0985 [Bifidobacterium thermophilum]
MAVRVGSPFPDVPYKRRRIFFLFFSYIDRVAVCFTLVPSFCRLQATVSDLGTIAKIARRVRHASRLLRVGLRGVDDERVKVIFAIFTCLLSLRENGPSRSSSTPSNPYGSKAEA